MTSSAIRPMTVAWPASALDLAQAQLDEEAAIRFAQEHPLSKSADYRKKFLWAKEQCRFLEENLSPDDIEAVRARCHCEAGAALARRMRGYLESSASLEEFAALFNEKEKYVTLEAVSGGVRLLYDRWRKQVPTHLLWQSERIPFNSFRITS